MGARRQRDASGDEADPPRAGRQRAARASEGSGLRRQHGHGQRQGPVAFAAGDPAEDGMKKSCQKSRGRLPIPL